MNFDHSDIGKTVNFSVFPSAVIPANYTGVVLETITSAESIPERSPLELHTTVATVMPNLAQVSFNDYLYYIFRLPTGQKVAIGDPWINPATIVRQEQSYAQIKVFGASSSHVNAIRKALANINFTNVDIVIQGDV